MKIHLINGLPIISLPLSYKNKSTLLINVKSSWGTMVLGANHPLKQSFRLYDQKHDGS